MQFSTLVCRSYGLTVQQELRNTITAKKKSAPRAALQNTALLKGFYVLVRDFKCLFLQQMWTWWSTAEFGSGGQRSACYYCSK